MVEFFKESTYVDEKGEVRPYYDITKKGCEFIENKLMGVKGTTFTAKYINRFRDMEGVIDSNGISNMESLIRLYRNKKLNYEKSA